MGGVGRCGRGGVRQVHLYDQGRTHRHREILFCSDTRGRSVRVCGKLEMLLHLSQMSLKGEKIGGATAQRCSSNRKRKLDSSTAQLIPPD